MLRIQLKATCRRGVVLSKFSLQLVKNETIFFMEVVRDDGKPYQPDVLSTMHRALKRYLDNKNYGW